jgi:hypothetical protein
MDNPRSEKVAVVDEVRQRFDDSGRGHPDRISGPQGQGPGRPAPVAAVQRRRLQDLQEHSGALGSPQLRSGGAGGDAGRARPGSPSSTATQPRWPRCFATTPGPTRCWSSRAGCSATRSSGPRDLGPGRSAVPRGPAGPRRRRPGGSDAAAGRTAAGPAPQPRLRPGGPARPAGRRRAGGPSTRRRARAGEAGAGGRGCGWRSGPESEDVAAAAEVPKPSPMPPSLSRAEVSPVPRLKPRPSEVSRPPKTRPSRRGLSRRLSCPSCSRSR